MNPALLVIAGPNGAGKTTVTARLRTDHWSDGVEYLNPDDIARDRFGDWNSPEAVLDAARWTEARREELLARRAGIAFETVFSAPDKVDFLQRARQAGYFLRLHRDERPARKVYGPLPVWVSGAVAHLPRHPGCLDLRSAG